MNFQIDFPLRFSASSAVIFFAQTAEVAEGHRENYSGNIKSTRRIRELELVSRRNSSFASDHSPGRTSSTDRELRK